MITAPNLTLAARLRRSYIVRGMARRFVVTFLLFAALFGGIIGAQAVANYAFENCIPTCSDTVPAWYGWRI